MTWPGSATSSSRTATFRASPTSETASSLALHDGRPGVDADPRIQLQLVFAAELLAEGLHSSRMPKPARAARRAASS